MMFPQRVCYHRKEELLFYFWGNTINVTCSLNKGGLTSIDKLLNKMCFLVFLVWLPIVWLTWAHFF